MSAAGLRPRQPDPELRLGVAHRDRRPPGPPRALGAARGRAVDRRAPEGSVARRRARGPRHPRPRHPGRPRSGILGPEVCDRFGNELPFLLKVLAAAEPLSIQAHPEPRAGPPRLGARERRGRPRGRPPPQLPRPEPQARARQRARRRSRPSRASGPSTRSPATSSRSRGPRSRRSWAGSRASRPRSPCARSSPAS